MTYVVKDMPDSNPQSPDSRRTLPRNDAHGLQRMDEHHMAG